MIEPRPRSSFDPAEGYVGAAVLNNVRSWGQNGLSADIPACRSLTRMYGPAVR
jgi:hypothetical protein